MVATKPLSSSPKRRVSSAARQRAKNTMSLWRPSCYERVNWLEKQSELGALRIPNHLAYNTADSDSSDGDWDDDWEEARGLVNKLWPSEEITCPWVDEEDDF